MNKKGDILDGMLKFGQIGNVRRDAPQIDDYPETVSEALRWFYRIFGLPDGAIPTKRSKSKFEEWVIQMQAIVDLFGKWSAQEVIELSFYYYDQLSNKFILARPLAIRSLVITAVSELNRREKARQVEAARQAEEREKEKDYNLDAAANMATKLLKKMKTKEEANNDGTDI